MTVRNFRVDNFTLGLAIKAPCNAFTTAAITLSGEQTVNTVALVEGDRCLVKNQADAIENGIYEVRTSAWVRTGDWDGNRDVVGGTLVPAYRASDGVVVVWQVEGEPDFIVPEEDAATFIEYLDPAGIPVAVTLQEVADEGNVTTTTLIMGTGAAFTWRNPADDDTVTAAYDASGNLLFTGANTSYRFDNAVTLTAGALTAQAGNIIVQGGNALRAENGSDSVAVSHDGTDGRVIMTAATKLYFSGPTVGYRFDGPLFIDERGSANADTAGQGQFWVRDDAPNIPMFTDDAGTDFELIPNGGAGGTQIGVVFAGFVDASVAAEQLPSGWSVTNPSTGLFTVTHNLGLTTADDLSITALVDENGQSNVSIDTWGTNSFDIRTIASDVNSDQDFFFIATLNVAQ